MLVYVGSGVANYTFNLSKTLLQNDKKNEYRFFYSSFRRPRNFYYLDELKKLGGKIYSYPFPPSFLRLIWGKLGIVPIEWFTGKVDVFFFSDFLRPPLLKGTRGVTTIHDLTWKLFPKLHTPMVIKAHEKKLSNTIKNKDQIIVDSTNTKNDLLKMYPKIDKNLVNVIYPGIGEEFKPTEDRIVMNEILKKYQINIHDKFLLYVGAIEPRKNLVLSIKVFSQLIKDRPFSDYKFYIAGRAGWKNEDVFQTIKDLRLENVVKFIGFVEDDDLPILYSAAALTVYLSSYEGFGLPPLESLACGTKVIAGNNSSLKETINKKYLIDVSDKNKVQEKMKSLLENEDNIDSQEIRKRFSWQASAQSFLKVIGSK